MPNTYIFLYIRTLKLIDSYTSILQYLSTYPPGYLYVPTLSYTKTYTGHTNKKTPVLLNLYIVYNIIKRLEQIYCK